MVILRKTDFYVKQSNFLIKNLYERESLPQIKIYTKISQLSPEEKEPGDGNEVNDARQAKDNGGTIRAISGYHKGHKN